MNAFTPTGRSRARRRPQRVSYDEAAVNAILDAGVMAHVAYVVDGQPYVTPTAYWREGRTLYWHGSAMSRMLAAVAERPVCVAVSFLDGFVVGRSGFVHSLNYRSVMAFGRARLVEGIEARRTALNSFIDRLYAGRPVKLRPATDEELAATAMVSMEIEEASAKTRATGVADLPADAGWAAWCGVFPVETRIGAALPEPGMGSGGRPTPDLAPYAEGARLEEALAQAALRAQGLPVST
jgi:uncharacterized protein